MVDSEVERIAELAWRAFWHSTSLSAAWPVGTNCAECWRAVARALIADRESQRSNPGATHWEGCHDAGPRHYECLRERFNTVVRGLRGAPVEPAHTASCACGPLQQGREAEREALATREPTEDDVRQMSNVLQNPANGFAALWRYVRDALLTAQPPVTDGPTLMEAIRERDKARRDAKRTAAECDRAVADARRERDAARARSVGAERERDALQRRLDALATREPTADEIARLEDEWEHAVGPVARWWWHRVRDALLTAQEPPEVPPGEWSPERVAAFSSAPAPAPITRCHVEWCRLVEGHAGPCSAQPPPPVAPAPTFPRPCDALLDPSDGTRCQLAENHDGPCYRQPTLPAGESLRLIELGREAERAAVVAWLRRLPYDTYAFVAADQIVDGDHLAAKERP